MLMREFDSAANADLLQSYEQVLATLTRLVAVTRRLIDAQQRGESIAPGVLDDYEAQLRSITTDRERLQAMILTLWDADRDGGTH